jgi:Uma2 family endonuclease
MFDRYNLTVDKWRRLGGVRVGELARRELLDGQVVEVAAPSTKHVTCVDSLAGLLTYRIRDRAAISVQNPVELDDRSEPRPDIALLRPRLDGYTNRPATVDDVLLLIEVSDTTLVFDRGRKACYYARVGVPECWVVDLASGQVLVMRTPALAGYRDVRTLRPGAILNVERLDGIALSVADIVAPAAA